MARLPCSITDPRIALLFMAFYALTQGALNTYMPSMITTLEKRFDLSSTGLGWLLAANDIGYLSCIIIIAYFGGKGNHVKALVGSAIGLSISGFILGLPFLIFGPKYTVEEIMNTGNTSSPGSVSLGGGQTATMTSICVDNVNKTVPKVIPKLKSGFAGSSVGAFAIQMIGGIINGIASCPFWNIGICFLDDMAGSNSGGFIGALFAIRSFSPLIGFSIGATMNSIHETLGLRSYEYPGGQRDPYWISAWWLGFFILGAAVLTTAPFLSMLRSKELTAKGKQDLERDQPAPLKAINGADDEEEEDGKEGHGDIQPGMLSQFSLKELYTIIRNLWTNPVYVFLVIGMIFEVFSFMGILSFFPKFLEFNFRVDASKASMFSAVALAGSSIVAMLISGTVSHLFPMSMRNLNLYHAIVNFASELLFPILFFFQCDVIPVIGQDYRRPNITCAPADCECPLQYKPVCVNGSTFYTACHAGCQDYSSGNASYSNCLCNGMTATQGVCEGMCNLVYPYVVVFFIVKMIGAIASVQFTQIFIKLSSKDNKPIALATVGFLFGILGMVLPPLSGMIMDTACTLRNPSISGKSFCLLYDTAKLGYLLHGISFGVMLPGCACYFVSWHLTKDTEPPPKPKKLLGRWKRKHRNENPQSVADTLDDAAQFRGSMTALNTKS